MAGDEGVIAPFIFIPSEQFGGGFCDVAMRRPVKSIATDAVFIAPLNGDAAGVFFLGDCGVLGWLKETGYGFSRRRPSKTFNRLQINGVMKRRGDSISLHFV